jgi:hypothetical protein
MGCSYPYYPAADWRFGVSRRFNHPYVDSIYDDLIQPTLDREGLLLECWFASEITADEDFWMNRIDLIFAISDFHILIDIDRNHNVEFEFERARLISRRREATALGRNLNWSPLTRRFVLKPITILIKDGIGKDQRSSRKRRTVLFLSKTEPRENFIRRLRVEIDWAKSLRLKGLAHARKWFEKRIRFFGIPSDELEFTLVKMTEIARSVQNDQLIETVATISQEIEEKQRTHHQIVNENFELLVRLKKGEAEIPDGFRDTYLLIMDQANKNLASVFSQEFADSKFLRWLTSVLVLIGTFRVRKKHRQTRLALAHNQNGALAVCEPLSLKEDRRIEDAVPCYLLGQQCEEDGNYEEGIQHYNKAIDKSSLSRCV